MFLVSGRLHRRHLLRPRRLSTSICLSRIEIAVQIAVDHQRRRVIAGAQADDRQQREAAVGGGLARARRRAAASDARAGGRSP